MIPEQAADAVHGILEAHVRVGDWVGAQNDGKITIEWDEYWRYTGLQLTNFSNPNLLGFEKEV